jgi:hypothetical protein
MNEVKVHRSCSTYGEVRKGNKTVLEINMSKGEETVRDVGEKSGKI